MLPDSLQLVAEVDVSSNSFVVNDDWGCSCEVMTLVMAQAILL